MYKSAWSGNSNLISMGGGRKYYSMYWQTSIPSFVPNKLVHYVYLYGTYIYIMYINSRMNELINYLINFLSIYCSRERVGASKTNVSQKKTLP